MVGEPVTFTNMRRVTIMKDHESMLKMMRFWLFGTFLIIFASVTIYVGMITGMAILGQFQFWLAFIIAAILFVVWYYIYKWYLDKKG